MITKEFEGVLPVLKPVGFTSHDVVGKVRRLIGIRRIGHTGTLDPSVTGVLPLCVGRATRIVEYLQELPKEYVATITFGVATNTQDLDGEIIEQLDQVKVTTEQIKLALDKFKGMIKQVPPMYSAVKKDGKRLYEWAREGITVEREARTVEIYELEILDTEFDQPHPSFTFRVLCSKGTYIRTLCVDIGRELGLPAVMSKLIRTQSGPFTLKQCYTLDEIEVKAQAGEISRLLVPIEKSIAHFPEYRVDDSHVTKALQGQKIPIDFIQNANQLTDPDIAPSLVRLHTTDGNFIGIYQFHSKHQLFIPEKIFLRR